MSFRQYPHRQIVELVTDELVNLLFPEHRIGSLDSNDAVAIQITKSGQDIAALLQQQVETALRHREVSANPPTDSAQEIVSIIFDSLLEIRRKVAEDARATFQGDPAARGPDEVITSYPTYVAVSTYRFAHELHELNVPFIPRMMTEHAHRLTGIDIHPGAKIGREFFVDHGTGVVIGETAEIGDRVKLYQGVTLGAFHFPKDARGGLIRGQKRHPTLEDDVTIFANATILGGDTVIGTRSVIGSNVWLTKSVSPDSIVTMEEPRLRIKPKNGEL